MYYIYANNIDNKVYGSTNENKLFKDNNIKKKKQRDRELNVLNNINVN